MQVEAQLIHPRFQRAIADEREALAKLGSGLRISPMLQADALRTSASDILKRLLDESLEDRCLSPDEEGMLTTVARQLGIDISLDRATRSLLDRCALLWRIEHGELPTVSIPIKLQRDELCHFMISASWH